MGPPRPVVGRMPRLPHSDASSSGHDGEISAYAETVGPTRQFVGGNDGLQPGDPGKAAQATLTALDAEPPPLRLVLGQDAIDNVHARLGRITAELTSWEDLGRATAIDEPSDN